MTLAAMLSLAALAQETPRPAPTDVVELGEGSECPFVLQDHVPEIVRTSVGLAFHQGDGTYALACPALWEDAVLDDVAVDPQGSAVVATDAEGGLWRTDDGGCQWAPVALPEGAIATDVVRWRNAFWISARTVSGSGGAVFRLEGETLAEVVVWDPTQTPTPFAPDGLHPVGPDVLWMSGATPNPQVYRLTFVGGLAGADDPISPLPVDQDGIDRIEPVAGLGDEVWFRVERRSEVWLWYGRYIEGPDTQVVTVGDAWGGAAKPRTLLGPIPFDGRWLAVVDGSLHAAGPGDGQFLDLQRSAPWTCLTARADKAYVCTVPALLALEGFEDGGTPVTSEIFAFTQVVGPSPACVKASACDAAWLDAAAKAGVELVEDRVAAICPDGTTADDLLRGSCACRTSNPASGGAGAVGLLLSLAMRRRRARDRRVAGDPGACESRVSRA